MASISIDLVDVVVEVLDGELLVEAVLLHGDTKCAPLVPVHDVPGGFATRDDVARGYKISVPLRVGEHIGLF